MYDTGCDSCLQHKNVAQFSYNAFKDHQYTANCVLVCVFEPCQNVYGMNVNGVACVSVAFMSL